MDKMKKMFHLQTRDRFKQTNKRTNNDCDFDFEREEKDWVFGCCCCFCCFGLFD